MLEIGPVAVPSFVFGMVTDQVEVLLPAFRNIFLITVTLEVFQEERFKVKTVAL